MSERLQGHRTKFNANKMTCDGNSQISTDCTWTEVTFDTETLQTDGLQGMVIR